MFESAEVGQQEEEGEENGNDDLLLFV